MNDEVILIPWASLIGILPGMFVPAVIFIRAWRELLPLHESRWWFLLSLVVWFGLTAGLYGLRCFTFDLNSWLGTLLDRQTHQAVAVGTLTAAIWGNGLSTPISGLLVLTAFVKQPESDGWRRGLLTLFVSWCAGWLVWSLCQFGPKFSHAELSDLLGWEPANLIAEYAMLSFPNWGVAVGWGICYAMLRRAVP